MFVEEDIFSKKEELNEELKPYLSNKPFPMLRHPLLYHMMYSEQMNAMINMQFKFKKEQIEKSSNSKDWETYIYTHERPYRLNAFLEVERNLSDVQYWEILGSIWTDSENIWQNKETWRNLIKSNRGSKEFFMSNEDRMHLIKLPNVIKVYRGCIANKNKTGLSYTLSKEKAEWFSKRFNTDGIVVEREVKKHKIFAYLNSRGEDEVIIL